MTFKRTVIVAGTVGTCAFLGAAIAVHTRLLSKQVITSPRSMLPSTDLSGVAADAASFKTDIPDGMASKTTASNMVRDITAGSLSNLMDEYITSGGVRFSVTGFYNFAEGSTVSLYNVVMDGSEPYHIEELTADSVWVADAVVKRLASDEVIIDIVSPMGDVTTRVAEVQSGRMALGHLNAGKVVVTALDTPVIHGPGDSVPSTEFLHQLSRTEQSTTERAHVSSVGSIVPEDKFDARVFTGTNTVFESFSVTNEPPAYVYTNETYLVTNGTPVYTYSNAIFSVTNALSPRVPDTGFVGVATTSTVVRTFPAGTLKVNAAGRCYINEPAAVMPPGSGTKEDPFIMESPENFRWVRENHTPGGLTGPAYDGDAFVHDGGSASRDPDGGGGGYASPVSSVSRAGITNGVLRGMSTYCIQTNDIDLADTYLWCSSQWPNGEYVEGFLGISGAPNTTFYPRIADRVPGGVISSNPTTATNVLNVGGLYSSVHARTTWPNKRFVHQIHYDGGGHTLQGAWVGVNEDARVTARGLLGSAAAAPSVSNLRIGGVIKGEWASEADPGYVTNVTPRNSMAALGGLFGYDCSTVVIPDGDSPDLEGNLDLLMTAASEDFSSHVSNCIVFADVDISCPGERDVTEHPAYFSQVISGGAYGALSAPENLVSTLTNIDVFCKPLYIYDSSFVGRRALTSERYGSTLKANRIIGGSVTDGAIMVDGQPVPHAQLFGYGHRIQKNIFLNNIYVYSGTGASAVSGGGAWLESTDGIDSWGGNDNNQVGMVWVGDLYEPPDAVSFMSPYYLAGLPQISELGYYGNIEVVCNADAEVSLDALSASRVRVTLAGRYGAYFPLTADGRLEVPLTTAPTATTNAPFATRCLAAWDAVRVASGVLDGMFDTWGYTRAHVSLTGAGCSEELLGTPATLSGESVLVVNAGAARDEVYGPLLYDIPPEERDRSANLTVTSRRAMTQVYYYEPPNEVGGGGVNNTVEYPYRRYEDGVWTRSGELAGWYPVPANAAGVQFSGGEGCVTNGLSSTTNELPDNMSEIISTYQTIASEGRGSELAFTNKYVIAATYINDSTCELTVVTQTYERYSYDQVVDTSDISVVTTNLTTSYAGSVAIDGTFWGAGGVSVSGTVRNLSGDYSGELSAEDNELGVLRTDGTNLVPVVLSPKLHLGAWELSFSKSPRDIHLEWWPDNVVEAGLSASFTHAGGTVALDEEDLYADMGAGGYITFTPPTSPGYIVIRPGHPTDRLVHSSGVVIPDMSYLVGGDAPTSAVFQATFVPLAPGEPVMRVVEDLLFCREVSYIASLGVSNTLTAAYIDGENAPYRARLRVDIHNASGEALDDSSFFKEARVYCNYAAPEYLIPGAPVPPERVRVSGTHGYLLYTVYVRQLVVLQAAGGAGVSVTATLYPFPLPALDGGL